MSELSLSDVSNNLENVAVDTGVGVGVCVGVCVGVGVGLGVGVVLCECPELLPSPTLWTDGT